MSRVLFIEPVLAHYRRDTFSQIVENNHFEMLILAGRNYEGVKPFKIDASELRNYFSFRFLNHRFYYLKGAISFVKKYRPDIVVCSGIDFHHIHTLLVFVWVKVTKRKFIWWSHGSFGKQGFIGRWLRGYIYRKSDYILVYSQQGENNLLKLGLCSSKVCVIGNAINSEDYGLNKDLPKRRPKTDEINILYTGRLTEAKRIDVLLNALKILKEERIHNYKCVVVGAGIIEKLLNLAKDLNVSDIVEFVGGKYGDEIVPYFQNADLYVYPSGIGLSILHALSYGLPVITTDNYRLHFPEVELLSLGINGDVFLDGNAEDLSEKIEEWATKVASGELDISKECINAIYSKGYLPEEQAKKIINVLSQVEML
ncbi:MAG: glycosyltransferase family 4 protein [Erysipelotrichaceae bacterium]|nr:glycosyltransferase family 4 protein [Erysipelotrichaceae bacterium]